MKIQEKWVLFTRHTLNSPMDIGVFASQDEPLLKHVEGYRCLTAQFKRPIEEIGDAWMDLGDKARKSGYQLTNHDREVYRMMDCDHPENNDIELQIGIK